MGKKKKAGNKLARMSEEERARYLQHRADIEEEARRRKQQLLAIFMKNKLKREEAFSRLNLAKINQEWRTILRNIKCLELRQEIKSVREYFDDALMRRNQIIDRLLFELDESEELYATMLHSHMENIDKLIVLHSKRLDFWKKQYHNEKQTLLQQRNEETTLYTSMKSQAHKELECVYFGLESIADEQRDAAEEKYLSKVDDIKGKMIFNLEIITEQREKQMTDLWKEFQSILADYSEQTNEKYSEYLVLRERDNEDTKQIRQHYIDIAEATNTIADLRNLYETNQIEQTIRMDQLSKYEKLLQEKYKKLKMNMENGLKLDKQQMHLLVVCSTETIKELQRIFKKGENIIQIASICQKLTTEREKVQPFGRKDKALLERDEDDLKKPPEDFKERTLFVLTKTEKFWIRYNNARIDCACLENERAVLRKQNALLKQKLKEYLTDISITNGRVGSVNERLRPSSMKVEKVVQIDLRTHPLLFVNANQGIRRRPVTCIEGNLSVAVRSKALSTEKPKAQDVFSIVH